MFEQLTNLLFVSFKDETTIPTQIKNKSKKQDTIIIKTTTKETKKHTRSIYGNWKSVKFENQEDFLYELGN